MEKYDRLLCVSKINEWIFMENALRSFFDWHLFLATPHLCLLGVIRGCKSIILKSKSLTFICASVKSPCLSTKYKGRLRLSKCFSLNYQKWSKSQSSNILMHIKLGFSESGVPPNSVLFFGSVWPNSVLFGVTVPPNSMLFGRAVLPNSVLYGIGIVFYLI